MRSVTPRHLLLVVLTTVTAAIVACGSSGEPGPGSDGESPSPSDSASPTAGATSTQASGSTPSARPGEPVSKMVSASTGGELTTSDGLVTFSIPPGALGSDTELSIVPVDDPDAVAATPFLPEEVAAVYRLEPAGIVLNEPVRIEISLDDTSGRAPGNAASVGDEHDLRFAAVVMGFIMDPDDEDEGEWLDNMAVGQDEETGSTRFDAEFDDWGVLVLTHPLASISSVFLDTNFQLLDSINVDTPFIFSMTFDYRESGRGSFTDSVTFFGEVDFSSNLRALSADTTYVRVTEAQNRSPTPNADFSVSLSPENANVETSIEVECASGGAGVAGVEGQVQFDFFEDNPPTVRISSQRSMGCNGGLTAERLEPARTLPGFQTTIFGSGFLAASARIPLRILFIDDDTGTVIEQEPEHVSAESIRVTVPEELADHEERVWKVEVVRDEQRASLEAAVYIESWPSIEAQWSYTGMFDECQRVEGESICRPVPKSGTITFFPPRRWFVGDIADEPLEGKANEERDFEDGGSCGTNWLWVTDPEDQNFGRVAVAPACDAFYYGELAKDYRTMTLTDDNGNVVTMTNLSR